MKNILTLFFLFLSFHAFGQSDNEYVLNVRTGKFDVVRSSTWAHKFIADTSIQTKNNLSITTAGYTYTFRSTGTNTNYTVLINTYDSNGNPVDNRFVKQNNAVIVYPAINCFLDISIQLKSGVGGISGSVDSTLMKSNYQARLDSTKQYNQIISKLGLHATADNSAKIQGKDSVYIKANWGSTNTGNLPVSVSAGVISVDTIKHQKGLATYNDLLGKLNLADTVLYDSLLYKPKIILGTPSSSLDANGIIFIGTAGESLVFGDCIYMRSDGKYWKAQADSAVTCPVMGMALGTVSANASTNFLRSGLVRDDSWAWATKGGQIWLSVSTAGAMTQTKPSASTNQVIYIGYARSATEIDFNPSPIIIGL